MSMNSQGRPTVAATAATSDLPDTFTGNRALQIEEALLFEVGRHDVTGVDLDEPADFKPRLGKLARQQPIDLPGLSEPETMRHYVRLSQKNYSIDSGLYPLGSCTMKHNPRLNEKMARLPGIGDVHPLQPLSTVGGAVELMAELGRWLLEMTGMTSVALSPKAGAHGELCGMMAIKAAIAAKGETRNIVLVPESAHGTNPATAALIGFKVVTVPARPDGTVAPEAVAWVTESPWNPNQAIEPQNDGSAVLTLHDVYETEITPRVLSLGGAAEVLEPAEFRERLAQQLKQMAATYE